jgi:hypothetical protein
MMRHFLFFTLWTNALAAVLWILLRFLSDTIASWKVIDLFFLTGVTFWLISTIVRLSSKRVKKEWNRNEVTLTDPQLVISSNNMATRFLIAGIPGIAIAIIWGFFY